MAVKELKDLREHNLALSKGQVEGTLTSTDVRDTVENKLPEFQKELMKLRRGEAETKKGVRIPRLDLSFDEGLKMYFGTPDMKTFLKQIGVYSNQFSLNETAELLGAGSFSLHGLEKLMIEHGDSFGVGSPANTNDIAADYRFIIPEIFASAIRIGHQHTSLHQNWIAATMPMRTEQIVMPQIKRGDAMPTRLNEGANIPMGSVQFGKKTAKTFKIGTGMKITDELMLQSTLDMLFIYLQEVGNNMAIGADSLALDVLVNGEQTDGSESAPVIGVITPGTVAYKDIKRVFTRMERMGQPASRIIAGEDDGINITGIDRFEGFQGQTQLASIRSIIGVPNQFSIDTHVPPTDQMIFVSPNKALVKLQFRGLMTERRRNPENQTDELFITDHIGFAVVKRDARVILDKSLNYNAAGFPDYMNIDSQIAEVYKQF